MKKVILMLVGVMVIGMYANSQVSAEEEATDNVTATTDTAETSLENSNNEKLVKRQFRSTEKRDINMQKFHVEISDKAEGSVPVTFPKTDYKIYYRLNDISTLICIGTTDANGDILNKTLKNVPLEGAISVQYLLGNKERGYVKKYNKNTYAFTYNYGVPKNDTINFSVSNVRFGNSNSEDSFFYNF